MLKTQVHTCSISQIPHAIWLVVCLLMMPVLCHQNTAFAEGSESTNKKNYNIQGSSLSNGLSKFAGQSGINLSFDPKLTEGRHTDGLKGEYGVSEGFKELLKGTGLQIVNDQKGGYFLEKAAPASANQNKSEIEIDLRTVKVRAKRFKQIGPMPGLELTKEQIAGNVQSITAKEIKESHSLSLSDLLNSKLQSVNVNDYQGNPFQMDVTYRGFTASPQIGTPQGLSVFFDGVRVNEPFGDVVNWDMLPMNALGGFDLIPGSNPLYGLNTLGGALTMKTKSGFTDKGFSAEILAGSFGRKQLQASGGWNNANKEKGSWDTAGDFAAFGAVNLFMEDGWRDNSPSKVNQAFGKLEWQGERASLAFSTLGVVNKLVGNGTVPQEIYNQNPAAVFTSPDETRNRLIQFQIAGAFDVNDKVNITGQVYHRQSNRKSSTGDIISQEDFEHTDYQRNVVATRKVLPGEQITCNLLDSTGKGYADYYVADQATYDAFIANELLHNSGARLKDGTYDASTLTSNGTLPQELDAAMKAAFANPAAASFNYGIYVPSLSASFDTNTFVTSMPLITGTAVSYTDSGNTFYLFPKPPINPCSGILNKSNITGEPISTSSRDSGLLVDLPVKHRNGLYGFGVPSLSTGVIAGTPTAVITKSDVQQTTQGATLQVNFNLDQHKAMVGVAIDHAKASYDGSQRYGLLDSNRNVYSAPNEIDDEFYAADFDVPINQFKGTSTTKSLYASETWSPTQTLNFSASARYNYTDIENKLAPKIAEGGLFKLINKFLSIQTCTSAGCAYSTTTPVDYVTYNTKADSTNAEGIALLKASGLLDAPVTETFSYHSLNPAFGVTWQAKPNLNLYANWNQGTRVPSVIELGCAYDGTLVQTERDSVTKLPTGPFKPRSIADGRGCSLPSALSGDPYLPQVKAQTIEAGARGKFGEFMEWNISAYRTDLTDDIYMTSLTPELNFFQDVGATRRQGLEFGLAGEYGKSDFRINYSLTEATFQSSFKTISPSNSSRTLDANLPNYNMIDVKPGNVMPGVPFNNMNFNWGYKFSRDFKVNLGLVAHSGSFLRGNENNAHTPSQGRLITTSSGATVKLPDNQYDGTAPGYAVFNLSSRYDMGAGWAFSTRINNLLDKKYYTAGRLGINPIAPSTFGAIGPGGFNYNSSEWIPSQFISAGAPRGIWLSVSYDFDASKKALPPTSTLSAEPNLADIEKPSTAPSAEEVALASQLDKIKALPLIKRTQLSTKAAALEVTNSVEVWRKALASNQAEAYLAMYAPSFAPAGLSHSQWAENAKLQFATNAVSTAEVNNVVVMPEGKRMVAIFNQSLQRGLQAENVRKVLTFELKDGQWQITREHAVPNNSKVAAPNASPPVKASQLAPPIKSQQLNTPSKRNKNQNVAFTQNVIYSEVK